MKRDQLVASILEALKGDSASPSKPDDKATDVDLNVIRLGMSSEERSAARSKINEVLRSMGYLT